MPVKKNGTPPKMEQGLTPGIKSEKTCCGLNGNCHDFGKKLMFTLLGILLAYSIVFMGTLIRNNLQKYNYIGQADKMERTIMVEGVGKVTAKPDIAMISMGMTASGTTVVVAQEKNTEVMNNLIAKVKALGISEDDIQTANYNIYPQYDYTEASGSVLKGYEVQQTVSVKIRDLAKSSQVLALAGEVGANNVSGLQFTIDDNEVYKAEARVKALKQVAEKAKALSQSLGVNLVDIVSYNEYSGDSGMYPLYKYAESAVGMGGATPAPDIQSGSTDIVLNVNVTFEIR
ncbi:MAG: SIMPL domain-containing protein [Candidatus Magasanikiibacteriota bacterium]